MNAPKTLHLVKTDPRVLAVWNEGNDGWWADLANDHNCEGCSQLHGETIQELYDALQLVVAGEPY